jgi:prepilin-type N-terminal cleavage/methylation domain-containing protein
MDFSKAQRRNGFDDRLAQPAAARLPRSRRTEFLPFIAATERNKFRSTSGFTLIEMLIVVSIMLVLVTAAATMVPTASESRRIREAARGVNIYLSSARNHAMETGRACGVTFHCLNTSTPASLNADQCEVPAPYAGDTNAATANISGAGSIFSVTFSEGNLPESMVRPGDTLQFNGQGPLYTIAPTNTSPVRNPVDTTTGYLKNVGNTSQPLTVLLDTTYGQLAPWGATAATVSYRIIRSPVKGAANPLQLPATAVVDLDFSGMTGGLGSGVQDLTVVFSPTGSVEEIFYGTNRSVPADPLYILIGKRERVGTFTPVGQVPPATKQETEFTNIEDLNNLWVTINPQTGLVNTEPVAAGATAAAHQAYVDAKNAGATDIQARTAAMIAGMNAARALATQSIGMGGR